MRYNDRAQLIKITYNNTPLGLDSTETSQIKPCSVQTLSFTEQVDLYGKTNAEAFIMHLRGREKDVQKVEYPLDSSRFYNVVYTRLFRNETVLNLERDSHE